MEPKNNNNLSSQTFLEHANETNAHRENNVSNNRENPHENRINHPILMNSNIIFNNDLMKIEDSVHSSKNEINYEKIVLPSLNHAKEIEIIYHISDLHIENNMNNYKEYDHVFDQLYQILIQEKNENKILIITGDILHERTKLYTETIIYIWDLLKKFNKIIPIIMIPGNHDINMRNTDKKDGITGIIYDRITSDMELHYLLNSGLYEYKNILFCYQSLFDKKTIDFIKIKPNNLTKIALYHGILNGAKTEKGLIFSKNRSVKEFAQYDFVLLGDIHYHQFITSHKQMAYAGSLISQDFGEDFEHGCIRWNIKSKIGEFIPISNQFSFKVMRVYDELIEINQNFYKKENIPFEKIPSNGKLKFKIMNHKNPVELLSMKIDIENLIRSKYKEISITFEENNEKEIINGNLAENFHVVDYESSIVDSLLKYLQEVKNLKSEDINWIYSDLSKRINEQIPKTYKCKVWKILSVKWNNLFIYGMKNHIDFERSKNIIGLIGKNSSGKSLFIEIILYLLYGREKLKDNNKFDLINKNEEEFSGEIVLEINNSRLFIKRKGKLNRIDEKSFEDSLTISTEKQNLTEFTKRESQKFIESKIGNYDDVKKINFLLQNENEKIFHMKRKERKEYFYRILNINFMEQIHFQINEDLKNLKQKKNELESESRILSEKQVSIEQIKSDQIMLGNWKKTKENLMKNKETLQEEIENLNRNFKHQIKIRKEKKLIYKENRENKKKISKLKVENTQIKTKKKINFLAKKNEKLSKKITVLIKKKDENEKEINGIKRNIEEHAKKMNEKLKEMVNDISVIKKILEDLKNDQKVDKNELDRINLDLIKEISDINEQINKKNFILNEKNQTKMNLEQKIDTNRGKIQSNQVKKKKFDQILAKIIKKKICKIECVRRINENNQILKEYQENEENEKKNQLIFGELEMKKQKLYELEKKINEILQYEFFLGSRINQNVQIFIRKEQNKLDYSNLSEYFRRSELLEKITSVNGFTYFLLGSYINQIQDKMNAVFGVYFQRNIKIHLENDAIDFKIINEKNRECASMGGCEGLLFELAFRISVAKIMKLPLCNILFIDEHLSVIDFEKRYEIRRIFDQINSYFEKILVITHDDTIRNYVDECIHISHENNQSRLNNCEN